jgi:hypothetical protein
VHGYSSYACLDVYVHERRRGALNGFVTQFLITVCVELTSLLCATLFIVCTHFLLMQ